MSCARVALATVVLGALFGACGCASEHGEHWNRSGELKLAEAPAPVQAAVTQAVGAGKLEKLMKESEDGQTVYEAEIEGPGDVDRSVKVSASGQVLEEETEVEAKDAPASVMQAVRGKYPSQRVKEFALVKAGGASFYEVMVVDGPMAHELKIDAAGKVLGEKSWKAKHEDGEDEKKESKD